MSKETIYERVCCSMNPLYNYLRSFITDMT